MTDRAIVSYQGDGPVALHPSLGNPVPASVEPGGTFEIDADVAETLDAERFAIEGAPEKLTDEEQLRRDAEERPEPVPIGEIRERQSEALEVDPEAARGAQLDGALEAAGLPTSGSLAERQDRLAAWQEQTTTGGSSESTGESDGTDA